MNTRVLFVDDEPFVLEGLRRQFRKQYEIGTASGPGEGLSALAEDGPFAVVVSDMQMPNMNGVEFLREVRARHPDVVRIILSGRSDMALTIAAVNEGSVFRFLTKPCAVEDLGSAIDDAIRQYQLHTAERELLEQTLHGAVGLLTDVLAMVSPATFSRASQVQRTMDELLDHLGVPISWELRLVGSLSFVGCLSVPDDLLKSAFAGDPLTPEDRELFDRHPAAAQRLLERIPRLEGLAEIVGSQRRERTSPLPLDMSEWSPELLGRELLWVAIRYTELLSRGYSRGEAYGEIRESQRPHPRILAALGRVQVDVGTEGWVTVSELRPGMVLDQDVTNLDGTLLLAGGHEVTEAIILRLESHASRGGVSEPIRVRQSRADPDDGLSE